MKKLQTKGFRPKTNPNADRSDMSRFNTALKHSGRSKPKDAPLKLPKGKK